MKIFFELLVHLFAVGLCFTVDDCRYCVIVITNEKNLSFLYLIIWNNLQLAAGVGVRTVNTLVLSQQCPSIDSTCLTVGRFSI